MSIYTLKPAFQGLLRPLVGNLAKAGITANQVTVFAALMSVAYGVALWISGGALILFAFLPLLLFVRMALNAVDGMLAREHGQISRLGGFLNEAGDVISDAALIAPFALLSPFDTLWIFSIIFLSVLTEFVGVLAASSGASRRYDGPMGKSDRAFLFGALGLIAWAFNGLSLVLYWAQPLLCISLIVTAFNRVRGALKDADGVTS